MLNKFLSQGHDAISTTINLSVCGVQQKNRLVQSPLAGLPHLARLLRSVGFSKHFNEFVQTRLQMEALVVLSLISAKQNLSVWGTAVWMTDRTLYTSTSQV